MVFSFARFESSPLLKVAYCPVCLLIASETSSLHSCMDLTKEARQMTRRLFTTALFVLGLVWRTTKAQEVVIGTDLCACQPSSFDFKLNFGLGCDNSTVQGDGIEETACIIDPVLDDPVPVSASRMEILELDQGLQIIQSATTVLNGTYSNGDTVSFTSSIIDNDSSVEITAPEELPRGLLVAVTGENADGKELVNTWVLLYTNDCDIYPVINNGMQIGWTVFVSFGCWSGFECIWSFDSTTNPLLRLSIDSITL